VRIGNIAYREDRLACELIGPVATCTAAFGHAVEMFLLCWIDCGGAVEGSKRAEFFAFVVVVVVVVVARWDCSVVSRLSSSCDVKLSLCQGMVSQLLLPTLYVYVFLSLSLLTAGTSSSRRVTQTHRVHIGVNLKKQGPL
jgi:hypothetical protein